MEGKTLGFSHRFKVVQYVCTNFNQKGLQRTAINMPKNVGSMKT